MNDNDNDNKLLDDEYYNKVIYNTQNTIITNTSISNGYTVCDGGIYEMFMDSLDEVKDCNLLMSHLLLDINFARKRYEGYLTNDELQEKQYKGRFWDLCGGYLYILVDDDTLLVVEPNKEVHIFGRDHLPQSLIGRYYYE